jgi:hypothetical protein
MTNYSDFLLNELAGLSGLDFDQTADVLRMMEGADDDGDANRTGED